jgi:hypothetical protein
VAAASADAPQLAAAAAVEGEARQPGAAAAEPGLAVGEDPGQVVQRALAQLACRDPAKAARVARLVAMLVDELLDK